MISNAYFWTNIGFLAMCTLAIRGSMIALSKRMTITARMKELFSYIPAAILPAIIMPAVWFHEGQSAALQGKERLVIALLAAALSYLTSSTLLTIGIGLGALYVVNLL